VSWYQHDPSALNPVLRFTGDGVEGWLAHVAGDKLLLKTFDDVQSRSKRLHRKARSRSTPRYIRRGRAAGPFTQLAPGQSLEWSVRWYLRQLGDVMVGVGSASLLAFVRGLVAQP
jgi:hypothetical protein